MRLQNTIISIALCAVFMPAIGQNQPKNDVLNQSTCAASKDLINTDLFGTWILELPSSAGAAITSRLSMERNPEFAESLAGSFFLGSVRHDVYGDIENGVLDLEESNNGKDIIAIWKGRVVDGSCAKAITGTRRLVSTQTEQSFVLRRTGW
ncbi:hypothetical protein [Variovorax sp. PCZ-1]|uniref:hypothetical protein n=1 Tax=Variovorax sp. PCZ-1 TaxID=2835533 RepID=UPI001BCA9467|nr:hypothetical protein [Variovorax sp. PCZ-1]MBS7807970.1 hypothetical protein [Variovorax sp. PCZ-1]